MDRINVLLDELLVKILTFLPTQVAISTSILSKRWESLWMWLPKLDYTSSGPKPGLGDFINKKLPLHRAPVIESLCLDFTSLLGVNPLEIRLWIEIAVSRHVHELECSNLWSKNIFPSSLFTSNSLVTLKLIDVIVTDVPSIGCLPCMKTLQLKGVTFVDEGFVQNLLSMCPVLEDLSLFFYDGDHYSLIKNMPKLSEAYVHVEDYLLKSVIESITSGLYGDGFVFEHLEHLSLCVCKENSSNLLGQLLKDYPKLRVLNISLVEDHEVDERDGMVVGINRVLFLNACCRVYKL